jgi:hypothetical protein
MYQQQKSILEINNLMITQGCKTIDLSPCIFVIFVELLLGLMAGHILWGTVDL